MMSLTNAPSMTLVQVEQYLDPYYGQWLISSAPPPIPFWQATTPSYKGGTATITATSRDELMVKMKSFIASHERLLATDAVANAVRTPSIVVGLLGGAAYAYGRVQKDSTFEKIGMSVGALGAVGLLSAFAIQWQADKNRQPPSK